MVSKKTITLLCAVLLVGLSWAGPPSEPIKPDFDKIELQISDPVSPLFYPILMSRYISGDSTLTATDYHYLYYGYVFQEGYKPLMDNPYSDSLSFEFGRRTSSQFSTYERMVRYARGVVKDRPFSMRDLNALAYGLKLMGKQELARMEMRKIEMIDSTIRATGTALTLQSPWYIIYMNDAEDVLNLMNANYARAIMISSQVAFIPVNNLIDIGYRNPKQRGFYFDYHQIYLRRPDYLDGPNRPKRKMELNPYYNPKSKLNTLPK
ncbi:MAG: DUF4919 domain-containing protein [Mucinivorans sp.]